MNTDLSETVVWWGEALVEVKERMVSSAANLFDQIEGRCRPEPNKYTQIKCRHPLATFTK